MPYIQILVAGFVGGIVRGLVGYIKHQFSYSRVEFKLLYFLNIMFLSGIVGLIVTAAVRNAGITFFKVDSFSPALAVIIGYAGGDFVENIYKIIIKKSSLYKG
ncbi:MAG: hypothetical protein ACOC1P_04925 [Minisyncoccales bacterium]